MVSAVLRCRPTRSGRVATRPGGRRRWGRPVPRGKQPLQQPAGLLSSFTPHTHATTITRDHADSTLCQKHSIGCAHACSCTHPGEPTCLRPACSLPKRRARGTRARHALCQALHWLSRRDHPPRGTDVGAARGSQAHTARPQSPRPRGIRHNPGADPANGTTRHYPQI